MNWPVAKCSTWLKNFADTVAGDAYKDGGIEFLYAAAGAAYYGVNFGIGYNSQAEFENFVLNHMKLDMDFLQEAIKEITRNPIQ